MAGATGQDGAFSGRNERLQSFRLCERRHYRDRDGASPARCLKHVQAALASGTGDATAWYGVLTRSWRDR